MKRLGCEATMQLGGYRDALINGGPAHTVAFGRRALMESFIFS